VNFNNAGNVVPDSNIAAGPSYLMEAVNASIAIIDKQTGAMVGLPEPLGGFFAPVLPPEVALKNKFIDPTVNYDDQASRFIVTALEALDNSTSYLDLAVSNSSDPTAGFSEMHRIDVGETTDGFLGSMYLDVLGQSITPQQQAYFDQQLAAGESRTAAAAQLLASASYLDPLINSYYVSYLHQPATPADINSWYPGFASGQVTDQAVQATLLGSTEYFQLHGGTNTGFLEALYQEVLSRAITGPELQSATAQLDMGLSRTFAAAEILYGPECLNILIQGYYQKYLRRPAAPSDVAYWTPLLSQGQETDEQMLAAILGSQEYFQLHGSNNDAVALKGDFDHIGWNSSAYVIAMNMFTANRGATVFDHVQLLAIQKASVLDSNSATFGINRIDPPSPPGDIYFSLQPTIEDDPSPAEPVWMVATEMLRMPGLNQIIGEGVVGWGTTVHVIRMDNVLAPIPTFTDTTIYVEPYAPVPLAAQPAPGLPLDTLDTRMLKAEWRNGVLVATDNVGSLTDGAAHVRWYAFDTTGPAPVLTQEQTLDPGPGLNTWCGSVAIAADGTIGMTYLQSATFQPLSMYVTEEPAGSLLGMEPGYLVQASSSYYVQPGQPAPRTGDFSSIAVDPVNPDTFWAINQYTFGASPGAPNTLWDTKVINFE
jgi:hypothetical protein